MNKHTSKISLKTSQYLKRKRRSNTMISSQSDRPRLLVSRSNKHIFAQIILWGKVLAAASDLWTSQGTKSQKAFAVGQALAAKAIQASVTTVAFDRNGYLYHWRVKQLAEWARSWWLVF
jgi:large subunit ribosomal protein L18